MNKTKGLFNKFKTFIESIQNKMILDASGVEIDFHELEDGDTPSVGDVATIEGKPAGEYNDGTVTLEDGTVYKFTGEELTEIIEPAPENKADDADDKDKEITELKKKIEELETSNSANVESLNKVRTRLNKVKAERDDARELITSINAIKNDQLQRIMDGEIDVEDDEDDEDEDDGFPTEQKQRVQNKKKITSKETETGSFIEEMNLNLFSANRK